ncbi:NAD(P)/FAD-dependent oxidoreductase [Kineococcus sp. SYSU DK003]|uniref:NAD(P)/FAD-dependent oxidoreductase n=1 Tax=Kineococcus sp. SYSU DK003 TaxID=3383124 RepID=UPI003D7CB890
MSAPAPVRILVVGGGYVGLNTCLRLLRRARPGELHLTLVDPRGYMTYHPFLPEAAAGSIDARNVVVSLRRTLSHAGAGAEVVAGDVVAVRHADRVARVRAADGAERDLHYDVLVVAPGSVSRTLPIPGLAEQAIGFKTVEEAVHLRNRVLSNLDLAESSADPDVRRRALTFVFVGGGYAGVEAIAEIEDMARYAMRFHRGLRPADLRFVLVEATDRILPEVGDRLGRYAADVLRSRGIDVALSTTMTSCLDGRVVLSDGRELEAGTIVWTAGVKAHPLLEATDLPVDEQRRLRVGADLRVPGVQAAWGAGDSCAVPDLTRPGTFCAPNAQHAVRQARVLADNLLAQLRGRATRDYRHADAGSVASLGLHKGVAQIHGLRVRGYPAWLVHRLYHLSKVPTPGRKAGVLLGWVQAALFHREAVALGALSHPFAEFERAARSSPRG